MPRVEVSELSGAALDWAVAKATGETLTNESVQDGFILIGAGNDSELQRRYSPSTGWSQGGKLIEDHTPMLCRSDAMPIMGLSSDTDTWMAASGSVMYDGHTPLIAACRAIVAAKLGDTVEVPEELC